MSRRTHRLIDLIVALAVLVVGLSAIAVITEKSTDAVASEPHVTADDVVSALRGRGLEVAPTGNMIDIPGLGLAGHIVQVNRESMAVVVFDSAAERVQAEQQLIAMNRLFANDRADDHPLPSLLSARNVLVVHDITDTTLSRAIALGVGDLAGSRR